MGWGGGTFLGSHESLVRYGMPGVKGGRCGAARVDKYRLCSTTVPLCLNCAADSKDLTESERLEEHQAVQPLSRQITH